MLCRRVGASLGLVFGPGWVEWMSLTLPRGCHLSAPVGISGPSLLCQGSDVLRGLAGSGRAASSQRLDSWWEMGQFPLAQGEVLAVC